VEGDWKLRDDDGKEEDEEEFLCLVSIRPSLLGFVLRSSFRRECILGGGTAFMVTLSGELLSHQICSDVD
jgi:hypothetical protein